MDYVTEKFGRNLAEDEIVELIDYIRERNQLFIDALAEDVGDDQDWQISKEEDVKLYDLQRRTSARRLGKELYEEHKLDEVLEVSFKDLLDY
jgi:hypothetical protein